ncbi:MAG TPA: hypothetical protein V6D22_14260 [Candidatus Obscuribacterales bacterium]
MSPLFEATARAQIIHAALPLETQQAGCHELLPPFRRPQAMDVASRRQPMPCFL